VDGGALRFAIGAWVVAFGATIGSFLNVVIARVPAGESVVRPRSRCPGCRSPIAWYDNVPVVSWLVLRGRCRRCGTSIPFRYLAVELAGGAAAWLAWARHGLSLPALAELAFVGGRLALACIDLATWLLPHVLTWPLALAGLAAGATGAAPAGSFRASAPSGSTTPEVSGCSAASGGGPAPSAPAGSVGPGSLRPRAMSARP
jgi:leader peptidase (prepilin peptidase)/N-methyltransferase